MAQEKGIFVRVLLVLVVVALAGAAAYFYWQKDFVHKKGLETVVPPAQTKPVLEEKKEDSDIKGKEKTEEAEIPLPEGQTVEEIQQETDHYVQMEKDMAEYFSYLDGREYIRNMLPRTNSYSEFKKIARKLEINPPVPAGESMVSGVMVKNITHFYRVLGKDDLFLIKEIIAKEKKSLEFDMKMFYQWASLGANYPNPEFIRPSEDVLYKYAGFLLNTIGGRAYLFRRAVGPRLLVSYYCVLIVHDADKAGKNTYGIDVLPNIKNIKEEISNYPDFKFTQEYVDQLTNIENYYLQKRQ